MLFKSIINHREFMVSNPDAGAESMADMPIIVLDIDSTLMNTAPRNLEILRRAALQFPEIRDAVKTVEIDEIGWNITAPLERRGVRHSQLLVEIRKFWQSLFFTDQLVVYDEPYPGAGAFLRKLKESGFTLLYLTGRHISADESPGSCGMMQGTFTSFQKHQFPCGGEEHFFFKPRFPMKDELFKHQACAEIRKLGRVVAAVDNEPANINLLSKEFPDALCFWFESLTSPEPEELALGILKTGTFL